MKNLTLLFLSLFTFPYFLSAQVRPYVEDFYVDKAEELARDKAYEDEDLCYLSSKATLYFEIENGQLVAYETKEDQILSLSGYVDFPYALFVDETSEVVDYNITQANKKKVKSIKPIISNYEFDGIFYSDAKSYRLLLPFKKKGQLFKVQTKKKYTDIRYLTTFYLTKILNTSHVEMTFLIPDWADFKPQAFNLEAFNITETVEEEDGFTKVTFKGDKLGHMRGEKKMCGPSHEFPHVLLLTKSYTVNDKDKFVFRNTADLYAWYHSLVDAVDNDASVIQGKVTELTSGLTSEEEKIKAIYYWVQDNIRYIAFEDGIAGFKPASAQEVYEKKYGDCKGMANLTKTMLNELGFDARLAWIGTDRVKYDYSIASLAVDNHMICALKWKDKFYFLDATEEFAAFGEYARRIQSREVLIEDGDNYIIKKVPEVEAVSNTTSFESDLKIEGEVLKGKGSYSFKGESKAGFMYQLTNISQRDRKDAVKKYIDNGAAKDYVVENIEFPAQEQRDGIIEVHYDYDWHNSLSAFDDELYISLDFNKEFSNFTFEDDRKYDYRLRHKTSLESKVKLEIPTGYTVTYMPEALTIDDGLLHIQATFEVKNNQLIYAKKIKLNETIVPKASFESWNKHIEALNEFYSEQVVLKKTE